MAHYLVIRLSAIGDVAMTVPVLYSAAFSNPSDQFTVLTQAFLIPLFRNAPENVQAIGINTKTTEKKLSGLLKFGWALSHYPFDAVLDLHDVLRSKVLRSFFRVKGKQVYVVDKARKARMALTRRENKNLVSLRPVMERYVDVFKQAGLDYQEKFTSLFWNEEVDTHFFASLGGKEQSDWIGVAPFAKHRGKIYDLKKMEEVIRQLSNRRNTYLFLLGGKGEEEKLLSGWAAKYDRVECVAGRFSLDQELILMSRLKLLICMDSANMHFASLVGTPVLSIWGATHPYAGFYGYRQPMENAIQLPLPCRPCSVFGEKPCYRGDWACMDKIRPEMILDKVNQILKKRDE